MEYALHLTVDTNLCLCMAKSIGTGLSISISSPVVWIQHLQGIWRSLHTVCALERDRRSAPLDQTTQHFYKVVVPSCVSGCMHSNIATRGRQGSLLTIWLLESRETSKIGGEHSWAEGEV